MTPVRRLSLVCLVLSSSLLAACVCRRGSSEATGSNLDGRTYKVTMVQAGGGTMPDDIMFRGGRFESSVCTRAGFAVVPYDAHPVDGGAEFSVQCDSPSMGHNEWHGVARGDQVEGEMTRTPRDGAPIHMTFSGALAR